MILPDRQKQITLIGDTGDEHIDFINNKLNTLVWGKNLQISSDDYLVNALKKYNVIPGDLENGKVDEYVKNAMNQLLNKQDDRARFYSYFAMAVYEAKTRRDTSVPGSFPPARSQVSLTLSNIFRFFQFLAEDCEAYINEKTQMRSVQPEHHTQKKTFDIIHMDNYNPSGNSEQSSSPYMNFKSEYVKRECENILRIAKFKEQNLNNGKLAEQQKTINVLISVPLCFNGSGTNEETDPTAQQMQTTILKTYRQILSDDRTKGEDSLYKNIKLLFLSSWKTPQERKLINTINGMNDEEKKQFGIFDYKQPGNFPTNTNDNKEHLIYCHPGDVKYWFGNENTPSFLSKDFDPNSASAETFFRYTNFIDYILPEEQRGDFDNTHHDYRASKNVNSVNEFTQRGDFQFLMPNGQVEICSKENAPWLQNQKLLNFNKNNKEKQNNNPENPPQNVPDYDEKGKISNPKLLLKSGNEIDIIKLANDPDNDGCIFKTKNSCWSWWVFPSFSGTHTELNFEDDSPIYKNIVEDKDMLNAYSRVLRKITNEVCSLEDDRGYRKNFYAKIDFIKAITCFNRIRKQILKIDKMSHEQRKFIKEFLNFSICLSRCPGVLDDVIRGDRPGDYCSVFKDGKKNPNGDKNVATIEECFEFYEKYKNQPNNICEELINELLTDELCATDLLDKTFSFDINLPQGADPNVNNGNTCFFHTAITMLAYTPFLKEAMEDYLNAPIKKDQKAQEFIQAYHDYITTGKSEHFSKMCQLFGINGSQQDSPEAMNKVKDFLEQHLRIKVFSIFYGIIQSNRMYDTAGKGYGTETLDYQQQLSLPLRGQNTLQQVLQSEMQKEKITDYKNEDGTEGCVWKEYKIANQPPLLPLYCQLISYNKETGEQSVNNANLKLFDKSCEIDIEGEKYAPFVCAEHNGTANGGHWIAYGNSIENVDETGKIFAHSDTLQCSQTDCDTFQHPEFIHLYNKSFYEEFSKDPKQRTIGNVIKRNLSKMTHDMKIMLIRNFEFFKQSNRQSPITSTMDDLKKAKKTVNKKTTTNTNEQQQKNDVFYKQNENQNNQDNNIIKLLETSKIQNIISNSIYDNNIYDNEQKSNSPTNNTTNNRATDDIRDNNPANQNQFIPKQSSNLENYKQKLPPKQKNIQNTGTQYNNKKNTTNNTTNFSPAPTQNFKTNKQNLSSITTNSILSTKNGLSALTSNINSNTNYNQNISRINQQNNTNFPTSNDDNNTKNAQNQNNNEQQNDEQKQTSYVLPIIAIVAGSGAMVGGILLRNNKIALILLCASGGTLIITGIVVSIKKSLSKNQKPKNTLSNINNIKENDYNQHL